MISSDLFVDAARANIHITSDRIVIPTLLESESGTSWLIYLEVMKGTATKKPVLCPRRSQRLDVLRMLQDTESDDIVCFGYDITIGAIIGTNAWYMCPKERTPPGLVTGSYDCTLSL